ncbi:hypothetical protein LXL04_009587 [Taraxacum kok-saghyz]
MSQKKASPPQELPSASSSDACGRRKRPSFRNVVLEVMNFSKISKYMEPILEPIVRKVVKEELESAMEKHIAAMNRDTVNETDSSLPRKLQLQFLSSLSLPVFTGTRIEGGDCNTLKVALIDASTGKTVPSGIGSLSTVEIVVLEGDFDSNEVDNWTVEEFNNNIVRERQGKKPLLSGNTLLKLEQGIGLVGDLSFTDNSSWTRSRKFRLGARVLGSCDGDRVREAKSESFVVRDHRVYKKHHPPYLSDEVWRLEKIGKDGAFHKRLNKEMIRTVKDFLALTYLDPVRLRTILGSGMSTKMWETAVEHAKSCVVDDKKLYLYCPRSLNRDGVVFNVVGQVLGLLSDSKYVPIHKLSDVEKAEAHKLVISAFQHQEKVVPYDDEASLRTGTCSISEDIYPSNTQTVTTKITSPNKKGRFDYPQMITSSSPDPTLSIYPVSGIDEYGLHSMESDDIRFDQDQQLGLVPDTLICESVSLKSHDDEDMQYFGTSSCSQLESAVDGFFFPHSAIGKAQRRWKIVSSVLRWLSLMLEIREREIKTPLTALYLRRTATANTSVRRPLSSAAVAPSVSSIAAPRATTSTATPSRNPPPRRSSPSQAMRPTFLSSASLHLHSRSHRRSSRKPPRNPPAPLDLTTAAQSNSPAPALLPPTEATTQPQQRLRANPLPSRDQNQVAGKNTNNLLDDSAPPQAATAAEDESSPKTWNLRPRRPPMKHKFSICGERRWRWSRGLLHCFTNSQFATSMAASWYDFNSGTDNYENGKPAPTCMLSYECSYPTEKSVGVLLWDPRVWSAPGTTCLSLYNRQINDSEFNETIPES